jgi:hypothetical protein
MNWEMYDLIWDKKLEGYPLSYYPILTGYKQKVYVERCYNFCKKHDVLEIRRMFNETYPSSNSFVFDFIFTNNLENYGINSIITLWKLEKRY